MRLLLPVSIICLTLAGSGVSTASELQLAGRATFRYFLLSLYEASLYTTDGNYRHGLTRPYTLNLVYRRDIRATRLVQETGRQWQQAGLEPERYAPWLDLLAELLPDVSRDDSLSLVVADNGSAQLLHNGNLLVEIPDSDFSTQFAAIWLSPDSADPAFTAKLTGNTP